MICRHIPTHWWVCGWLGGSVGQWVGLGQMTKNLISLDLIKIIQFSLKILFVETPPPTPPPIGGWLVGSVGQWVGLGQMTNN